VIAVILLLVLEVDFVVGAVTKGFVRRVSATAKRKLLLVARNHITLRIDERNFAFDPVRTVLIYFNHNLGHEPSKSTTNDNEYVESCKLNVEGQPTFNFQLFGIVSALESNGKLGILHGYFDLRFGGPGVVAGGSIEKGKTVGEICGDLVISCLQTWELIEQNEERSAGTLGQGTQSIQISIVIRKDQAVDQHFFFLGQLDYLLKRS
jgi:hypothetical protein